MGRRPAAVPKVKVRVSVRPGIYDRLYARADNGLSEYCERAIEKALDADDERIGRQFEEVLQWPRKASG